MILGGDYLDGTISPSLQLISGVDESLNSGSIDMGTKNVVSMRPGLVNGSLERTPQRNQGRWRAEGACDYRPQRRHLSWDLGRSTVFHRG